MRLTLFGASGGVGRELARQASERGHLVRAVARSVSGVPTGSNIEPYLIQDITSEREVSEAVTSADAVLSAVGLRRKHPSNPWSRVVSPLDLTSRFAQALAATMPGQCPAARLVVVSAAGVGDSRPNMSGVLRWMFDHSNVGVAYRDLDKMERILRSSSLDWIAVRPVTLTNGRGLAQVRITQTYGLMDKISRADVAGFMLDALSQPTGSDRTPMIAGK